MSQYNCTGILNWWTMFKITFCLWLLVNQTIHFLRQKYISFLKVILPIIVHVADQTGSHTKKGIKFCLRMKWENKHHLKTDHSSSSVLRGSVLQEQYRKPSSSGGNDTFFSCIPRSFSHQAFLRQKKKRKRKRKKKT